MENGKIVIDKIKFMDKQGRIKIDFKNGGDTNGGQFSGIYSEPADPVFYETMKSLRDSAASILELPGRGHSKNFSMKNSPRQSRNNLRNCRRPSR